MQKFKFSDGNEIPAIGFGTWRLKGDECKSSVLKALEVGYRHIDTAEHYGNQTQIGEAIQESGINRKDLFITSKIFYDRLNKKDVLDDTKRTLEELQTDYLDLLLVHWPNKNISINETVEGFNQLKQSGKVKSVGVSNFTPHHTQDFLDAGMQIVNNQVELHPSFNQNSLHEFCKEKNIILTAYSPIAQGQDLDIPEVQELSKKYDVSPAQVILNWIVSRGVVAIPRSSKPERILDNFNSLNWQMEKSDVEKMNAISQGQRLQNPEFSEFDY